MTARSGLVFQWPTRKYSFLLAGFLLLSLLIHLFGFYLFQIVYPPSVSIAPPTAQVLVLDPGNPEHQKLLKWIAAEDPARTAIPDSTSPPGLLDPHYVPSYEAGGTRPKVPAVVDWDPAYPDVKTPIEMFQDALPGTRSQARQPVAAPLTRIRISATLAGRKPEPLPALKIDPVRELEVLPTTLMIGVAADGEPRYIFEHASSGNVALDRLARDHLASVRFTRSPEPVTWGFVTYRWGGDALAAPETKAADQ